VVRVVWGVEDEQDESCGAVCFLTSLFCARACTCVCVYFNVYVCVCVCIRTFECVYVIVCECGAL
jgi:hypothetical protein